MLYATYGLKDMLSGPKGIAFDILLRKHPAGGIALFKAPEIFF